MKVFKSITNFLITVFQTPEDKVNQLSSFLIGIMKSDLGKEEYELLMAVAKKYFSVEMRFKLLYEVFRNNEHRVNIENRDALINYLYIIAIGDYIQTLLGEDTGINTYRSPREVAAIRRSTEMQRLKIRQENIKNDDLKFVLQSTFTIKTFLLTSIYPLAEVCRITTLEHRLHNEWLDENPGIRL